MNQSVKYPFALAATFLWLGFLLAISFMEAWLKFQAPGVSLSIGLGIGKLVFAALNKMEWAAAIIIITNLLVKKRFLLTSTNILFFIPLVFLAVQTIWLLPVLDARADLYIQGAEVAASNFHFYYIATECIKVICLLIFGIKQFKI